MIVFYLFILIRRKQEITLNDNEEWRIVETIHRSRT